MLQYKTCFRLQSNDSKFTHLIQCIEILPKNACVEIYLIWFTPTIKKKKREKQTTITQTDTKSIWYILISTVWCHCSHPVFFIANVIWIHVHRNKKNTHTSSKTEFKSVESGIPTKNYGLSATRLIWLCEIIGLKATVVRRHNFVMSQGIYTHWLRGKIILKQKNRADREKTAICRIDLE